MPPQGIMSSDKASNSPGLRPVKGQKETWPWHPDRVPKSVLEPVWGCMKTLPPCPLLVNQPTSNPSSYILSRDSQGQLRSMKPQSRAVLCELVGDLISSCFSMSRDPVQPTACWVEISFNVFWHCWTNGDVVLTASRAFKAA
jgi:hypothetical protein